MVLRIGLLIGSEWAFPPVFIEQVKRRYEGVIAEFVLLGGTSMNEPCPYALLIDRVSHQVPYFRSYLKNACYQGVPVINNPFMWTADDKFFQVSLAASLGVATPRTMVLPNKHYGPTVSHPESLRNLVYPLDWEGIVDYVGLPCVLKDAIGEGRQTLSVCESLGDLIDRYNQSGLRTMIVQQFIPGDPYIRCLCVGQKDVQPIPYDSQRQQYVSGSNDLDPELRQRVVEDSLKLVKALGYDLNAVDWAVHDGVPYVIDFMNPAPPLDVNCLGPAPFDWVLRHLVDLAIRMAKNPSRQVQNEPRWAPFLAQRA